MVMAWTHSKEANNQHYTAVARVESTREKEEGQPKKSWRRTVAEEHQRIGMMWKTLKSTAKNNVRWTKLVGALWSGRRGGLRRCFGKSLAIMIISSVRQS